jgi:glycosyltransferase involved in cell wall biosynthesis
MENEPLVSVVFPVYNGVRWLRIAVDGILNQTLKDFELIIIDDGSTDGSFEVLKRYRDSRIRLYHQENQGMTKTFNKGLGLAKGKYIARQDADDISEPRRFEKQVNFLEAHPEVALVGTWARIIDEASCLTGEVIELPTEPEEIRKRLYLNNCIAHPTVMYRSSIIKDLGGYNENYYIAQDYDLWLRIIDQGYDIVNLPEFLCLYRQHNSQGSTVFSKKTKEEAGEIRELAIGRGLKRAKDKDERAWLLYSRGVLYCEQGNYREAIEEFDKALSLKPASNFKDEVIFYRAKAFTNQERYSEAWEDLKEIIHLEPPEKEAKLGILIQIVQAYIKQHKYREIKKILKEVLSLKLSDKSPIALIHYTLGSKYEREGNLAKARENFGKIIELVDEVSSCDRERFIAGAHFHLGEIYQTQGNLERARVEFEKCLKLNSAHRKARENLKRLITLKKYSVVKE